MKYFKTTTDGTRTTSATENIQFLRMMLHGESLREIDIIASQFGSTTNGYLNLIKEGLLSYSPPINASHGTFMLVEIVHLSEIGKVHYSPS